MTTLHTPAPGPALPRPAPARIVPTCDSTVRSRRPGRGCGPRRTSGAAGDGRRRAPGRARASRQLPVLAGSTALTTASGRASTQPGSARRALALACSFSRLTCSFDIMLHMHISALADRYGIYGALKQRAQSHCGLTPHARSHPPPRAAPQPHRDRRGALPRAATSWS